MSVSAAASASKIQMDYMKLLVTQLQNQNPLEPMDNSEMASQLAQFSQLEQLESMNSNFAEVLETTRRNYATSLIGKQVSFLAETEPGVTSIVDATVNEVHKNIDGQIVLTAGDYILTLDGIISVKS